MKHQHDIDTLAARAVSVMIDGQDVNGPPAIDDVIRDVAPDLDADRWHALYAAIDDRWRALASPWRGNLDAWRIRQAG